MALMKWCPNDTIVYFYYRYPNDNIRLSLVTEDATSHLRNLPIQDCDLKIGSTILTSSTWSRSAWSALLANGLSLDEVQSGKPVIGIAQSGSGVAPCNRIHIELAKRVREGIREAGGIALVFPAHPIQETLDCGARS